MEEARVAQHRFARLWTQCQNCAEDMSNAVECGAKDCPIFYMREKARVDLEDKMLVARRFDAYDPTKVAVNAEAEAKAAAARRK